MLFEYIFAVSEYILMVFEYIFWDEFFEKKCGIEFFIVFLVKIFQNLICFVVFKLYLFNFKKYVLFIIVIAFYFTFIAGLFRNLFYPLKTT